MNIIDVLFWGLVLCLLLALFPSDKQQYAVVCDNTRVMTFTAKGSQFSNVTSPSDKCKLLTYTPEQEIK